MDFSEINTRGLVLLGCGKMGSALLEGWLKGGINADAVYVLDPNPSDWLRAQGVHINATLPENPAMRVFSRTSACRSRRNCFQRKHPEPRN